MQKLTTENLFSLEKYSEIRQDFRSRVIEHKKNRRVSLGQNAALYFEDTLTIQYQVQEMLRIEKLFESREIEQELNAYNPLIPDGNNWKATFMLEFPDPVERKKKLSKLIGIEDCVWVEIEGFDRVYAIADEDLDRDNQDKTSSVHFLRFQLTDTMVTAARSGASVSIGVDHEYYFIETGKLSNTVKQSLIQDLH